jgi:hypothetical protein
MHAHRRLLAALALSSAMLAFGGAAQAAPAGNMTQLPNLTPLPVESVQPIDCRRYRHCHSRCVRRGLFGKCRRRTEYCHRC